MLYTRVTLATIEVHDHRSLLEAAKMYRPALGLIGCFKVDKPLTPAQFRRLPNGLRKRLECGVRQ
jgi:hypothetical protein